jgi:hypothetical protein
LHVAPIPLLHVHAHSSLVASPWEESHAMDTAAPSANTARRNEDIALDLLKFITVTAGLARQSAPAAGFVATAASKPEDQVAHLLDLYTRCLQTVAGK